MSSLVSKTTLLAIASALVAACAGQGGGSRVSARVMSLRTGSLDARGLQPVAGARVALACPAGTARDLGKTDADGTLRTDADNAVALDCNLNVSQDGYRPVKVAVTSVCTTQAGGVCRELDLRTVLQPEALPASQGAAQ